MPGSFPLPIPCRRAYDGWLNRRDATAVVLSGPRHSGLARCLARLTLRRYESMRTLVNRARTGPGRLILTAAATLALTGGSLSVAALTGATAASATPVHAAVTGHPATAAHPAASRSAVVVKERTRGHFGKILVTVSGKALYYQPHGSCTAASGCLAVWPRLMMPAGKTMPKGANCLGTARVGSRHRLQVTYRKHRLYTFASDMGTSVTGNGVAGFKVAKVLRSC